MNEARIHRLIDETHKIGKNANQYLRGGARELNRNITENLGSYVERNAEFRTADVYPAPPWYANRASGLDVCTEAIDKAIDSTVAHIHAELGIGDDGGGQVWKNEMERLLQKKVDEALAQINDAQDTIDEIAADA